MLWKRRKRARASLEELARRAGKRVGEGLVGSLAIRQDFTYTFRFVYKGHKTRCSANSKLLCLDLGGVSTCLAFSVGRADRTMGMDAHMGLAVGPSRLPVFGLPGCPCRAKLEEWLTSANGAATINALGLRRGDSLHVYVNAVNLYVTPRGDDENWALLDELAALADVLPPAEPVQLREGEELVDGVPFDARRLPQQLHPLLPYLREWAISDDEDRVDRQKEASTEELERMYLAVSPYFEAINTYLDAVRRGEIPEEPDRYESTLLEALAECVDEAQVELQERKNDQA